MAQCISHNYGYSSTGKEELACAFKLLEGPNEGEHITKFFYFTPKALKWTHEGLSAMGWDGVSLADLGALDARVSLTLRDEEFDGKTHTKVAFVNPLSDGAVQQDKPMSDQDVSTFAAKMQGRLASLQQPESTPVPATSPLDDDVPF